MSGLAANGRSDVTGLVGFRAWENPEIVGECYGYDRKK